MFKKLVIAGALIASISGSPAQAAVAVAPVVDVAAAAGSPFWPFFIATTGGAAAVYLIATGVPFPLCDQFGLKCTYEYPQDKHFSDQE